MKIYFASDHAGFELKAKLIKDLEDSNYEVEDLGAHEFEPSDDYPDFVTKVAKAVASDSLSYGIVVGGSGQGEAMASNRVHGARTALFYGPVSPKQAIDVSGELSSDPYTIVRLSRMHNNANVLSIGARFVSYNEAATAVKIFLDTQFSDDERHVRRLSKF
ncbi:MAG: hypothetical protein RL641_85 [Candidatus Parcubacteria bacterium]|jgi:ribose 5-phosphate isomerase B